MKRIFSFVLAALLLVSAVPTALATNDYSQGTQVVYEATGSESYTITVPALLAPGGSGTVTLEGTWADNRIVTVTADETVTLTNSIKVEDQKVLNVHFDGISEAGSNTTSQTFTQGISVDGITNALFGTWSGKFNYNVEISSLNVSIPVQATDSNGQDLNATSTEITGTEKQVLLDKLEESGIVDSGTNVDALIEINSDEFENLAETTFNVSEIAQPGDKVIILHYDETKQEWEYIGEGVVQEDGTITANFSSYSPVGFVVVKDNGTTEDTWPVYFGKYYELVGADEEYIEGNTSQIGYAHGFVFYPDGNWYAYWEDEITDASKNGGKLTYIDNGLYVGSDEDNLWQYATLSEDRKTLTLLTGKQLVMQEDPELIYNQPYIFTPYGETADQEAMYVIVRDNGTVEVYDQNNVHQETVNYTKKSNRVWLDGDTIPSIVISDSGTVLFIGDIVLVCPVNNVTIPVGAEYGYTVEEDGEAHVFSIRADSEDTFTTYVDGVAGETGTYLIHGDLVITSLGVSFAISEDGSTIYQLSPDRNHLVLTRLS